MEREQAGRRAAGLRAPRAALPRAAAHHVTPSPPRPPHRRPAQLLPSLAANWALWIPAQAANFTLVPLDLRILYVNVISIAWTAYISNMASAQGAGELAGGPDATSARGGGKDARSGGKGPGGKAARRARGRGTIAA